MTDDDHTNDDKTVKELIDAATRAELERWFGLPSFTEVEEQKAAEPAEDPEIVAVRERRAKAIAAVDPAMIEAHRRRTDAPEDLIRFKPIDLRVVLDMSMLDQSMIDRQASIAEPREVEIPEPLRDDLRDCTPQALLRDLHRPERDFDKAFEITDYAADRVDVVGMINELMATRYKVVPQVANLCRENSELLRELRTTRMQRFTDDQLARFPNRRVTG